MSLVLLGSTSGSVTLQEPAVAGSSVLSLPAVTDTLAGIAATQTLTNKTLTSPTLTTPVASTTIGVGGATASASGAGITFPATQSASTDANTLDDYEEGTWTPSLGGTTTYGSQSGTYTKVGRLVFIRGILVITAIGTGSTTVISGLPFTNASGQVSPVSVGSFFTSATAVASFFARISNGGSTIDVGSLVVAGTTEGSSAIFTNNTQLQFSGCYIV